MHHIIYKTTCLVTGRYYIGMHSSEKDVDSYLGSGKIVAASLKKHGRKNHTRETIARAGSREELRSLEEMFVTEDLLKDPLCMNLAVGGCGSGVGRKVSLESRQKMSEARKGWAHMSEATREKSRAALSLRQKNNKGAANPRSQTWVLLSPTGELHVTKAMSDFCRQHGLNYFSLRNRAQFKDVRPITRGVSAGWAVLKRE